MFRRSETFKVVDEEWHLFRERARQTENSLVNFSDIDIEKYDLKTARIGEGDHFVGGGRPTGNMGIGGEKLEVTEHRDAGFDE